MPAHTAITIATGSGGRATVAAPEGQCHLILRKGLCPLAISTPGPCLVRVLSWNDAAPVELSTGKVFLFDSDYFNRHVAASVVMNPDIREPPCDGRALDVAP